MKSLNGKWRIAGHEKLVWEFTESRKSLTPSGAVRSGGRLSLWYRGLMEKQVEYIYHSGIARLTIDRPVANRYAHLLPGCKKRYRVEWLDDRTLELIELR